ncbi:MAG TPA: hypothetical protein VJ732_10155 [Bryobacteraceae bacterium]|nr:hypothetical protein [Bryobacteraceae bacterium]
MRLPIAALPAMCFGVLAGPLAGQWLNYPTAGIPRTPDGKPDFTAACPRTADGKPDLSGLWIMPTKRQGNPDFPGCEPVADEFINIGASLKGGLPYQPWAATLVKTRRSEQRVHDPMSRCLPIGPIRLHTWNGPQKFVQTRGLLVILNELDTSYRQIFTDGRPLPADPNPSWNGYSSGKWEGDTLVVETNGLRDGIWLDAMGNPMTGAARITERFRRIDFGHLEIELTVNDPKAYTKSWTVTLHEVIDLNTDLLNFICADNEKDSSHLSSK